MSKVLVDRELLSRAADVLGSQSFSAWDEIAEQLRAFIALSAVTAERDALRKAAGQHPFAQKVIKKLRRFEECAEDSGSGGVDIGRHWLDVLTQLGLLNRVQRSPACWEITAQGEDVLAAMAAKEG